MEGEGPFVAPDADAEGRDCAPLRFRLSAYEPPAGTGGCAGSIRVEGFESNPESGAARYGNVGRNGLSFLSTPSPSGTLLPFRIPATTWSSMSTTSSPSLRP